MRKLTWMLMEGSEGLNGDGGDANVYNSGDNRRKGISRFRQLKLPLPDSLIWDDQLDVAELLVHSTDSGVVPNGGFVLDSGDRTRWFAGDREG
jgi:hypothetical protein